MTGFIMYWVVMALTFVILTLLPTGIESDSFGKTGFAALVFGLLNGLLGWFINSTLVNILSLGLVFLVGNTILFGLTALIVPGFRLKWGVISALIGGLGTAVISGFVAKILVALF
ncbi:MAG: phage holin family protein [Phormidesmis sp.]